MGDLKSELQKIYNPLIGQEFDATYKGKGKMKTANDRDILIVKDPKMEQMLSKILQNIASTSFDENKVWKGVIEYYETGEYHMYIQLMEELDGVGVGKRFTFKVVNINVFGGLEWIGNYQAGVNIVLSIIWKYCIS